MMPENANAEDDLFEAVLLRSPGAERAAFLDGECRSDPELRARLEMMLEGHLNADGFLEAAIGAAEIFLSEKGAVYQNELKDLMYYLNTKLDLAKIILFDSQLVCVCMTRRVLVFGLC